MHTHQVQTTSFSLRDRKDRPQWILLLIFNEPPGLKTACLPLLFHIQETNNDSAGKHIGRRPSYLPVCLLAINPPTRPWIINASILCFARSAPSQQREWATSWLCGLQSVAMPLSVSSWTSEKDAEVKKKFVPLNRSNQVVAKIVWEELFFCFCFFLYSEYFLFFNCTSLPIISFEAFSHFTESSSADGVIHVSLVNFLLCWCYLTTTGESIYAH